LADAPALERGGQLRVRDHGGDDTTGRWRLGRPGVPSRRCASLRSRPASLVLAGAVAHADDDRGGAPGPVSDDPPFRVNLRIGGASTDRNGMPTVCGEVRVWGGLGVESCGTGAQLWHDGDGAEMMHLRTTFEVVHRATPGGGRLGLRAGVGFAEVSVAADQLGFQFGAPDATKASAAGPEASVSAQWTRRAGGQGRGHRHVHDRLGLRRRRARAGVAARSAPAVRVVRGRRRLVIAARPR
jgi:hypothetical protein